MWALSEDVGPDEFVADVELLNRSIHKELDAARVEEERLMSLTPRRLRFTVPIILALIAGNIALLVLVPQYELAWVISSFIFLIINPFILMIPGQKKNVLPDRETRTEFTGLLKNIGMSTSMILKREKKLYSEIIWNFFFINCYPIVPGFIILFSINILLAWESRVFMGEIQQYTSTIITLQSVAIILFYLGIWVFKPYTPGFFTEITGVGAEVKERVNLGWFSALRFILLVAVLAAGSGVIFVSALLFPGMTLGQVISGEDVTLHVAVIPLVIIGLVFLTQVALVRYFQGIYSRLLVMHLFSYRAKALKGPLLTRIEEFARISVPTREDIQELIGLYKHFFKLKVYRVEYLEFIGLFPVYVIVPDIQELLAFEQPAVVQK